MAKSIFKEIGIVLLLLIAVGLVLAIIFYDYIPNNKTVPMKIEGYKVPEDVKQELEAAGVQEENIVKTFYIDSTDLNAYETTKEYNKGKANPFADYSTDETGNNNTSGGNSSNPSSNEVSGNTNTDNQNEEENTNQNEVYITTPGKNY